MICFGRYCRVVLHSVLARRPVATKQLQNNEKTAVARQSTAYNNGSILGNDVVYEIPSEAISCDRLSPISYWSAVQGSEEWLVR
jgi:hypothetical protein